MWNKLCIYAQTEITFLHSEYKRTWGEGKQVTCNNSFHYHYRKWWQNYYIYFFWCIANISYMNKERSVVRNSSFQITLPAFFRTKVLHLSWRGSCLKYYLNKCKHSKNLIWNFYITASQMNWLARYVLFHWSEKLLDLLPSISISQN